MSRGELWALIVLVSLAGSIGNILLKNAVNFLGDLSVRNLLDLNWAVKTIFNPVIFSAFFLIFVGRFASLIPTSHLGITTLVMSITIITLIYTGIFDIVYFKTSYTSSIWLGFILGMMAIYFFYKGM
jgi:hypothetical protein